MEGAAFCRQDLPPARQKIRKEYMEVHAACDFKTLSYADSYWGGAGAGKPSVPLYMYTPGKPGSNFLTGEEFKAGSLPHVPESKLEHCEQLSPSTGASWKLERFGPLVGEGQYDWHRFGWKDIGQFGAELAKGDAWVTAFYFGPTTMEGEPLGVPPVHIHHMHVSTSQTHPVSESMILSNNFWGTPNEEGVVAVEFDTHGDRQCQYGKGGTDCLFRELPTGYGMKLLQAMDVFGDLNDVRPAGSPKLFFSVAFGFKWTTAPQRPVGRLIAAAGTTRVHDNYLMTFDPSTPVMTEYMMFDEMVFPVNATIVYPFFHSHHKFTTHMWWFSATAEQLGLKKAPFASLQPHDHLNKDGFVSAVNLTSLGMSMADASNYIMENLEREQDACLAKRCRKGPQLRCMLNLDRWDKLPNGDVQERFHSPRCDQWDMDAFEIITIVSFHRPFDKLEHKVDFYQHDVFYAYYTAKEPGQPIPHAVVPLPVADGMGVINQFTPVQ
uniref:Uncharacterized protein n=1 Tax=Chrysotila carterae TaxID=13221 RepID=A0A7S4C091_CHRCT